VVLDDDGCGDGVVPDDEEALAPVGEELLDPGTDEVELPREEWPWWGCEGSGTGWAWTSSSGCVGASAGSTWMVKELLRASSPAPTVMKAWCEPSLA
jgi:hypothetical protein